MEAKHLKVGTDKDLYNSILKEINSKLNLDKKKSDRYFLFKALFYFGLAILSYSLIFVLVNPILYVLNFILFGFITVLLCFNFAHDLSHHSILKSPFWNNFFFEFIYTLVGAHPEAWKERHVQSHHFAPNVKGFDTDLSITGLIRVLPNSDLKWYHKYQHLYATFAYMSYSLYWVFIKDFLVLNKFAPTGLKQRLRYYFTFFILKAFYVFYLLILPLYYSQQPVWLILTAFIVMHLFQSLYTLYTFFITHHIYDSTYPEVTNEGLIDTSWFMNQVKSSNDFYPFSNVANFIFGGVNCHIAHHLFPHINHYHYPRLNRILYTRLSEKNIVPSQTSFGGGIISHLKLLKERGKPN
jgi:linoleoyl-CoA desaturase